jgi:transcriptional regulator with XRE-family HTH domain
MSQNHSSGYKVLQLNRYIQSLCGLYSRVARQLGVDRSYVSRVARGERRSQPIEQALISEFDRIVADDAAAPVAASSE